MSGHMAETAPLCKHCGLTLKDDGSGFYLHAEGMQRGLTRCAADPYGFNAEPVGTECGCTCNGDRGMTPVRVYPPAETGGDQ